MSTTVSVVEKCPKTEVSRSNNELFTDFRLSTLLRHDIHVGYDLFIRIEITEVVVM